MPTQKPSSSPRRPASGTRSPARRRAGGSARRSTSWCYADFVWFCSLLTLPDGRPLKLEPFWRFILKTFFRTGLVELLVLLPKGNGKTTILAALAVFHLLVTPNAECFVVASDKIQADALYKFARHYIEDEGALEPYLLVRASTREIRSRRDQGFLRVLASDKTKAGGKAHSYNPTLAIIEELHAHENANAYMAMRTAAFKSGGQVLDISTAGWDKESTLGQLRTGMLKLDQEGGAVRRGMKIDRRGRPVKAADGRLTIAESKRNVMLEWACTKEDDLDDTSVVKLANPASWVTEDSIEDGREAPGITDWAFARYRANVWTLAFESWIPQNVWPDLAVAEFDQDAYLWPTSQRRTCPVAPPRLGVVDGDAIFASVDMGRYSDTAAITVVAPRGEAQPVTWLAFVEKPRGIDFPVEYEPVKQAIRDLDSRYRLLAAGYDDRYFNQAASELEAEGLPMVLFPQSNERMCPASANLREAILKGGPRHDGDPILAAHVMAGATKDIRRDQWRLVKSTVAGAPPVDALIALAMAHQLAFFRRPQSTPFVEVLG